MPVYPPQWIGAKLKNLAPHGFQILFKNGNLGLLWLESPRHYGAIGQTPKISDLHNVGQTAHSLFMFARLFVHQTLGLGGEHEDVSDNQVALAGKQDMRRHGTW